MSDWFSKFEAELRGAAARMAEPRRRRRIAWRSRGTLLVGIALIAASVPAVAAVTGAFDDARAPRHLRPGSMASLAPPCGSNEPYVPPAPVKGRVPDQITQLVGVLKRPQTATDRIAVDRLPHLAGVFADGVRLAMTDRAGLKYYLVPAANINYGPPVPNTPACERFRHLQRPAEPGVCVWLTGASSGGGTCASVTQLRNLGAVGPSQGYGQGMRAGSMRVVGVATDGVTAVVLKYPSPTPVRRVRVPVHSNVWAAVIRGRPEIGPAVYAQTRSGLKLVIPGPQKTSARQRALNRRSDQRDRAATSTPTVVPPVGYPHTTFTFRVRVEPRRRYVYVVRVIGPRGRCRDALPPTAIAPRRSGPLRGLIKIGIGYGPLGLHRMCLGHYRGEVRLVRSGAPVTSGTVVKRFAFSVRRRPLSG